MVETTNICETCYETCGEFSSQHIMIEEEEEDDIIAEWTICYPCFDKINYMLITVDDDNGCYKLKENCKVVQKEIKFTKYTIHSTSTK